MPVPPFFFLIPKSTTSDRPTALLPNLIRWWDRGKGRDGTTSRGTLVSNCVGWKHWTSVGQNSIGATTLVVDLAKVFEKVQLNVVWNWTMYFLIFHKEC